MELNKTLDSKTFIHDIPKKPVKVSAKVVALSKTMSWALRHGVDKLGLTMDDQGYVLLNDLLKKKEMMNVTVDEVKTVVMTNDKQRFSLLVKDSETYIRANQGHSRHIGEQIDDDKACIKIIEPLTTCIHGTTNEAWKIIKIDGLKPQSRKHIHFAKGVPSDTTVISGARGSSKVLIYIDMKMAMDDGIEFYLSANGVILSEGKDGKIDPKYFKKIEINK
jgi:2'-phosphotransferase